MPISSKHAHHRRSSVKTPDDKSSSPVTASSSNKETADWPASLADLVERHARALAALERSHGDRLARLEDRLASTERATADLGGQIQEMR